MAQNTVKIQGKFYPLQHIEIKNINYWKEALANILAYSTFFPGDSKGIHLVGHSDLAKLFLAQAARSEFGIAVTFEEVQ